MLKWFRGRQLEDLLNAVATVKVHGIKFKIKKIDALNFMDGSQAVVQMYQSYEAKRQDKSQINVDKIKKHYSDVFLAAVLEPKLCRKEEEKKDGAIWVENLFTEWTLVNELYAKILEFTYGKKKIPFI